MRVHFFVSESSYNQSIINFIDKNFDLSDQLFVFRSKSAGKQYSEALKSRIIYAENFIKLFKLFSTLIKAKRIYFHYLPYGPSLFFWYIFPFLIKKSVWIFWGGDIYAYQQKNVSFRNKCFEFCRKSIIKKLPFIAGFIKGDFELIKEVYHTQAKYIYTVYPLPVNFQLLNELKQKAIENSKTTILLGNSADPSNNHIEAIEFLEKFATNNIEIFCPLSYGVNKAYVDKVIEKGKATFGEKFKPMLRFLSPDEYSDLLKKVDVAIMNHKRQQGLGNVLPILYLQKKVYLRADTTPYDYFINKGIQVFDTLSIKNINFEEFIALPSTIGEQNSQIVKEEFSEENYKRMWTNVLSI